MVRFLALMLLPLSVLAAPAVIKPWSLPAAAYAAQPSLSRGADGSLNLSWIERRDNGHRLRFARFSKGHWGNTRTIAEGDNWFVNWADFPSTTQLSDGTLWAHNLVKSAKGTSAYDVVLYRSTDAGMTWSAPIRVNDDGTSTEHGFASLWPWSKNALAVAWLDGRNTAGSSHDAHAGQNAATHHMMTLRAAVFDDKGRKSLEWPLDASTCDCCQTDAAITDKGPVVIYRDRDRNEIRDIYTIRHLNGRWQKPEPVAADQWRMPACPVNGPAIAAQGHSVWAAWYTGSENMPKIRLAYSDNNGAVFSPARIIRSGSAIQGRVDLAADDEGAWLLWTEESTTQELWLQRISDDGTAKGKPIRVATGVNRGRASGFARMQTIGQELFIVWADVVNGKPQLRGTRLSGLY